MNQRLFFLTFLLFAFKLTIAQELPKIAPLSPEVSNLAKYSEVPVSYYTGVPNISIPIYTLKGQSISIPISLSYHAGGHKVTDIASRIGLGWSLNAGGQVYRVMRQLPDDLYNNYGYLTTMHTIEEYESSTIEEKDDLLKLAKEFESVDYAPDEFHFNFLGHSGKFMFNQNRTTENPKGEMVFFPESDIQVEPFFDSSGKIITWKIITTEGHTYFFGGTISGGDRATDRIRNLLKGME